MLAKGFEPGSLTDAMYGGAPVSDEPYVVNPATAEKNRLEALIPQKRFEAALAAFQHHDCDLLDDDEIICRVLAAADAVRAPLKLTYSDSRPFIFDGDDRS